MVVFTCQHCGSSVNKNKVEKHYSFECHRNAPFLTCVDCLKDFRGDEHVAHTSCVTEGERYGGKNFVPKVPSSIKKRGDWLTSVESALNAPGITKQQKDFINSCLNYTNIPQKRNKFHNFITSSFGRNCPAPDVIDKMFDLFEEIHKKNLEKVKLENEKNNAANENRSGEINDVNDEKTKQKRTKDEIEDVKVSEEEKVLGGVTKEKKKKKRNSKPEESETQLNVSGESLPDNFDHANGNETEVNDPIGKKLTKKERKEKKKKEKYQAELNEIENSNKENADNENEMIMENAEENDSNKKKKKKNKHLNGNCDAVKQNGNEKKKKRRFEDTVDEPVKKKSKASDSNEINVNTDSEPLGSNVSFNWDEMIVKVLESCSNNELPLKRLSKKIINEYNAVHGNNHMTFEKLMSKFNKKVNRIPSVKVLKDKAKLVTC